MKKALKRHGSPATINTDGLASYEATMKVLANTEKQEVGRWANNRAENSHLSFRRRERAMLRLAERAGLATVATLNRAFRRRLGVTPELYRARFRLKPGLAETADDPA